MIEAEVGVAVPLELMLPDGASTKGVQAFLQAEDGTELITLDMVHMARGRYTASYVFAKPGYFFSDFITYTDATYTEEDLLYTRRSELLRVMPSIDLAASFAAIPQAVWTYPVRLITNDFSNLADKQDVYAVEADIAACAKTTYVNKMSTTFDTITGMQEVIVWAEKDGAVIQGGAGSVAVKNPAGSVIWSASLPAGNDDGVYRYTNPIVAVGEQNFYIVIGIVVDGVLRVNLQPFYTIS